MMYSGAKAIARGAWEGGANFVSSYPGSPVTDIVYETEKLDDLQVTWASNEKVSLEIAAGVSHAGARALVVMKHVGLNVAADPLFNLAYTGVKGGLVIIVGDDPGAKNSQNEQDTRLVAQAANLPILEPANVKEAYIYTKLAFDISEQFDLPVIIRVTSEHCYGQANITVSNRKPESRDYAYATPIQKYLLLPDFVPERHGVLVDNLHKLSHSHWNDWLTDIEMPKRYQKTNHEFGIICSGSIYQLVKEIIGEKQIPILKLGLSFPINKEQVLKFTHCCDQVLVLEESSNALLNQVQAFGIKCARRIHFNTVGEIKTKDLLCDSIPVWNGIVEGARKFKSQSEFNIPVQFISVGESDQNTAQIGVSKRPAGFCAGCSHSPIFYELKRRDLYVVGDIGCYTLGATKPFSALDANLCMGASIGILHGYLKVMPKEQLNKAVAVIGDSTFFHSGITPLITSIKEGSTGTILILDNSGAAMTGHQTTAPYMSKIQWSHLLTGLGVPNVEVVDALDLKQVSTALESQLNSDVLSVIVAKGDCVQSLPKAKRPTNYRYEIDSDLCTSCGKCLETDCPSIVLDNKGKDETYQITNECIGCGFCSQTCPEKAIVPRTINANVPFLSKALSKLPWHRIIRKMKSTPMVNKVLEKFEREFY